MGTGQMMAIIVAISLLGIVSLSNNTLTISNTKTMLEAEASLSAISIAQTLIDEIETKSYDLATLNKKIMNATEFTAASGLGPSSQEQSYVKLPDVSPFKSLKYYNDLDDYHGYQRIVTTPRMGDFKVKVSIVYVSESNPEVVSTSQTFHKKIVVSVSHLNLPSSLELSDISVYRRYF